MSDLARALLEDLAGDPLALERLRELVGGPPPDLPAESRTPAYTVATLAAALGRSERSIRAAIARGELQAVKRGRGFVMSADAVADWARAPAVSTTPRSLSSRYRRSEAGPATRALRGSR
jgi:excisionase family DNA binding protein